MREYGVRKLKCTISYDGTNFYGFQIQPKLRTVQGELEKALMKLHKGDDVSLQASGRTDKGVHAIGQVVHFETAYTIPEAHWKKALNRLLPGDVYIKEIQEVPSHFHARYSALDKEYHYLVWNTYEPDVFRRNYVYHFPYALDLRAMQEACHYLQGEHDFTSFSSTQATVKGSKIRHLYEVRCEKNGHEIRFIFRGNGFLYRMVRIMVGTLLEIGQGKRNPADIPHLLEQKDRRLVGKTAPARGLYLYHVNYNK
ncbi:MAG TPA: tRNA pseudouridine(38-40) synthase TruA [Bacillota bacterium]|nr:tRNA pseudouridine(38-40) synthase TruA [Bacillota bacterium]